VEVLMIKHVLAPLDGSVLAESVLPHIMSISLVLNAQVSLLHVIERNDKDWAHAIDPIDWHVRKDKAKKYIEEKAKPFIKKGLKVHTILKEGNPAEHIINYTYENDVDLVIMSSHGQSGISDWNIGSVVQKVMMGIPCSTLLVRASHTEEQVECLKYKTIFIGLDCSPQAEFVLPLAGSIAEHYKAKLVLGTVIKKVELLNHLPFSHEEEKLLEKVLDLSKKEAQSYLEKIKTQLEVKNLHVETRLGIHNNISSALMDMVDEVKADLVLLSAHGHSSEGRHSFGSMATSFIVYGNKTSLIMQNLPYNRPKPVQSILSKRGSKEF
jgi:nucleotide-binding universal stress UspA family protein